MVDYEQHHNDKSLLREKALPIGELNVSIDTDLEQLRNKINDLLSNAQLNMSSDWCFLDSCTSNRFFRIDRAQENLHYVTDIANESVFILEPPPDVNELETALPSPSSDHDKPHFSEMEKSPRKVSIVINDEPPPKENEEFKQQTVKELCRKMEAPISTNILPKSISQTTGFRINYSNSRSKVGKSSGRVLEAARCGDLKKLKELHSDGFSLLSQNQECETALHLAAQYGQRDIIKYLITSAPYQIINISDGKKGHTALHRAVLSKHKNICCMLVAAGASLTALDKNGKVPKELSTDADITIYLECQEEFIKMANNSHNFSY